ncbi:MAG TPA: hypothetical protein VIG44_14405, partial [Thermomicrobiales bacterium]
MSEARTSSAWQTYRRRRIAGFSVVVLLLSIIIGAGMVRPFQSRSAPGSPLPPAQPTDVPVTSGNARVALPADSGPPAASIATGGDSDYVWTIPPLPASVPADLRERLASEVGQMVKAGHLAPLPLIGGVGFASGSYPWDLGGAEYNPYTLAWLNPADSILALSQAFPLLPPDQQASLRTYLRAELDGYPIDSFEIGGAYTSA